jgi:DNA polymerase bacteriophage-type
MRCLVYDIETKSTLNLKLVGSYIYSRAATTDVRCVSYCFVSDGTRGPISTWLPSDPVPDEIITAAADPDTLIVAFNDAFDRQIEQSILHPRYGWPIFSIERRCCAQAIALAHALPAALDSVAAALRFKTRKTAEGKRVMKLLAQPRKPRAGEDPTQIYWHDTPERLATLYKYNRIDTEITADIVALLGFLPHEEEMAWRLDAAINSRGLGIDVELLNGALNIADEADAELRAKLAALTDGEITSPAQIKRVLTWLALRGCALADVRKETVLEALKRPDLTRAVKELLTLRLDGAHAAVDKLTTLRRWTGDDQRIRQVYRYHGAMTGRFTSLGAQMQNLKKPQVKDVAGAIAAVRTGSLAQVRAHFERPLAIIGDITRALVVAAPGHRLFIADLSGIESRGLAWLCNEQGKLKEWREYDRSKDPKLEPYYLFGTRDLGLDDTIARKTGKTADLAFGYQGSVGAWRRLAPPGDSTSVEKVYTNRKAWVRKHPNIKKFWSVSVRQAINAVESGDCERFTAARIAFQRDARFLHLELPSGRRIRYPFARVYADEYGKSFTFRDASGGRWEWYHVLKRRGAFGGLIAENATQAICRDIFVEAMLRLVAAGYRVVAHLHDEVVCEVPDGFGDLDEFISIITTPPVWAPDFPIAAKGRVADRLIEFTDAKASTYNNSNESDLDDTGSTDDADVEEVDEGAALDALPATELLYKELPPALSAAISAAEPIIPLPGFDSPPPRSDGQTGSKAKDSDRAEGDGRAAGNGFGAGGSHSYAAGEEPRGTPTARYIYKDAGGCLFMCVIRTSNKSFPTQHWRDGRWVNGWPTGPVIPYRLPELLAAPASEPVFICEGEKDADNVAALGLIATTNPGGAGKWRAELAQWFKGRQLVYVLEDNDDAGREHTAKIVAALHNVVPTIVTVTFPELSEKGDVSDWLEAGGNKNLLLARAAEAHKRSTAQRNYTLVELHKLQLEATDWLWEGHLIRGELELIAGRPGVGKTQVQCQMIACITTGRDWPDGQKGPRPGRVILITAEDKAQDYHKRLLAADADLSKVKLLKYVRRNNRDEMFLLSEDLDKLEQAIIDVGDVRLVAIDPITAFMGSGKHFDSHRATDVRSQLGPLGLLAEKLNVAFSTVTHPPKNASQRAIDHFIGSQAYIAVARIGHICIDEMEDGDNGPRRPTGRLLFANPKNNFSALVPTLAYRALSR